MESLRNNLESTINNESRINNKNKPLRVFAADAHGLMLDKIVQLLAPHFEIVGTATDGKTALEEIENLQPDIAVLEILMPLKNGIEIAADLKANKSKVKVINVTVYDDEYYRQAAVSAGASAFVAKNRLPDDLLTAIESVQNGKVFISPNDKTAGQPNQHLDWRFI